MQKRNATQMGWAFAAQAIGTANAVHASSEYLASVEDAIRQLEDAINNNPHRNLPVDQLQGFMFEDFSAETFNIDAIASGSNDRAVALDSNDLGSVDVRLNSGKEYSLKSYATGEQSATEQARLKRSVEDMCKKAQERGINAEYFHGDMDSEERSDIVKKYRNGEIDVIFATNAFGMGIDIPDIRMVIHFLIPESVEQYYQEIGRASRDHNGGKAYLLYTDKNVDVKRSYFIEKSFPDEQKLKDTYLKLTSGETGLTTLQYFEDEDIQQCLPYFLSTGLIQIVSKGFSGLAKLENIKDPEIQRLYDLTKLKKYVLTLKKSGLSARELSDMVYAALVDGTVSVKNGLERWLIIDRKQADLDDENLAVILADIKEKKKYKHGFMAIERRNCTQRNRIFSIRHSCCFNQ